MASFDFPKEFDKSLEVPVYLAVKELLAEARRIPLEDFNRAREANLKTLRAIRGCVVATGTPHSAKTLDDRYRCMFGLPWSGRRHNKRP